MVSLEVRLEGSNAPEQAVERDGRLKKKFFLYSGMDEQLVGEERMALEGKNKVER